MTYTPVVTKNDGDNITATEWNTNVTANFGASPAGLATAKGDMFFGTSSDAAAVILIGTTNQIVEADSAQAAGAKNSWAYVPIGGIIMWSGAVGSIPSNWQLCTGTNGTPNLTGKFIIGAGSSYAVGATGGGATANLLHNHSTPLTTGSDGAHTHTEGNTAAGASHVHAVTTTYNAANSAQVHNDAITNSSTTTHTHTIDTAAEAAHVHSRSNSGSDGAHTHTITLDNQLSATQAILPPYYALAYIMRLS
jgi:hypothetical protein